MSFLSYEQEMLLILLFHQFDDISDFDMVEITLLLWHSVLVKIHLFF